MVKDRKGDLIRFYQLLDRLSEKIGGPLLLSDCNGRMSWPSRGVYFFMEPGEARSGSGTGLRIVRVGTHGLRPGTNSTLWQRLSQHKGPISGNGNHRSSIFRLLIGTTTLQDHPDCSTWGVSTARRDVRVKEEPIEQQVSQLIYGMPFLFLDVDDPPSPNSLRGIIERNSIALLSNFKKQHIDPPSSNWRGRYCNRERVQKSGLWNQNHVDEDYNPNFLEELETLIEKTRAST